MNARVKRFAGRWKSRDHASWSVVEVATRLSSDVVVVGPSLGRFVAPTGRAVFVPGMKREWWQDGRSADRRDRPMRRLSAKAETVLEESENYSSVGDIDCPEGAQRES